MNVIIRKMKTIDIKAVQNLAHKVWNDTYDGIIPFEIQKNFLNMAYHEKMIYKRMHASLFFVIEIDKQIVGFANFQHANEKGQAELSAIYIDRNYQGLGLGTLLIETGIKNLKNLQTLYLDVEKENEVAKMFYASKGFKVHKEYEDNFEGHTLKTIRMCLTL